MTCPTCIASEGTDDYLEVGVRVDDTDGRQRSDRYVATTTALEDSIEWPFEVLRAPIEVVSEF